MVDPTSLNPLTGLYNDPFTSEAEDRPYAAIGRVAEHWAFFEHMIDRVTAGILEVDAKRAACLSARITGIWEEARHLLISSPYARSKQV